MATDGGTRIPRTGGEASEAAARHPEASSDKRPVKKGVILAAGKGSRLSRYTRRPKMLQPLVGVPLVERAVLTLMAAGMEEIFVVYGAHPEVGEYCARRFAGGRAKVRAVYAPRWEEGNGASLAAVAAFVDPGERFVSVAGDHLADSRSIARLALSTEPAILADPRVPPGIDYEEATKVVCEPVGFPGSTTRSSPDEVVTRLPLALPTNTGNTRADTSMENATVASADAAHSASESPSLEVGERERIPSSQASASWRVTDVGKEVDPPPGARVMLDAGAHLLTSEVFAYLGPAANGEEVSVSRALRGLAASGRLFAVEVPSDAVWQDIDTLADLRWAKKKLLASLASPKDGLVARCLNRKISLRVTGVVSRFRPSPNSVSVVAFLTALGAAVAVAWSSFPAILAALLVQMASIVDGIDGEIARATFTESRFGSYLDGLLDRLADAAIVAAVGLRAAFSGIHFVPVLIASVAATSVSMLSMATKDKLAAATRNLGEEAELEREKLERVIGNLGSGRDGRLGVLALLVAVDLPLVALSVVSALGGVGLVVRTLGGRKLLDGASLPRKVKRKTQGTSGW